MTVLREPAWGKLNLALDVGALRPDGYHEMRMIMQTVTLCDQLTIQLDTGRWWVNGPDSLPHDERNLALRAARAFCEATQHTPDGVEITLDKQIPTCAGMGGGSADAAAVLRALQRHYGAPLSQSALLDVAAQVGSDVPFCLRGGTMLAEGRGEVLTPLPALPQCSIVLCKPEFSVSTPALFRALDAQPPVRRPDFDRLIGSLGDLPVFAAAMENVFEPLLAQQYPELYQIRDTLLENGALGAMLTGTGSVVFGIFDAPDAAEKARKAALALVPWAALAQPCGV